MSTFRVDKRRVGLKSQGMHSKLGISRLRAYLRAALIDQIHDGVAIVVKDQRPEAVYRVRLRPLGDYPLVLPCESLEGTIGFLDSRSGRYQPLTSQYTALIYV